MKHCKTPRPEPFHSTKHLFLFVLLGGLFWGGWSLGFSKAERQKPPEGLQLLFSGSREGEIEPCGCEVHQIGGLHRLAEFLRKTPSPYPRLLVEVGDTFFSLPTMPKHPSRAGINAVGSHCGRLSQVWG